MQATRYDSSGGALDYSSLGTLGRIDVVECGWGRGSLLGAGSVGSQ